MTTTLWRVIENMDVPAFGMISQQPVEALDAAKPGFRYFIRSPQFAHQFPGVTGGAVFQAAKRFCRPGRGPIGSTEVLATDSNDSQHVFAVECFNNSYDTLTLGVYVGAHAPMIAAG